MYAITPRGVGNPVGMRRVNARWDLREDEFLAVEWSPDMVLAEDGQSLRARTEDENEAAKWAEVRAERDRLLADTDKTQVGDHPLSGVQAWLDYRQALRDITMQPDPESIVWPEKPDCL